MPQAQGTARSTSLDGCLVTESWSSDTTNHKGENTLAYNADDKAWRALFVDNQGRMHALKGTVTTGVAELQGPSRDENGHAIVKRVRIVRVDADHSQQIWERSADNGRTWTTEYRMDYLRRKTQGSLPQPDATVDAGVLVGTWAASAQGRVAAFLGIPYRSPSSPRSSVESPTARTRMGRQA